MQILMSSFEHSTQSNPVYRKALSPVYHPPKGRFKLIYQGFILPNLPAPLYFLNCIRFIGQPRIPLLFNSALTQDSTLNTASSLVTISPHQVHHLKSYAIDRECQIEPELYRFDQTDGLSGDFPNFKVWHRDPELEVELSIQTLPKVTYLVPLKWNLLEHWSMLCHCKGTLKYQNRLYEIEGMGSFDYARAANIPYLPLAFYVHQVINLDETTQVILSQMRNQWNQVVYSKFYIRTLGGEQHTFTKKVRFQIHRVYPKITTSDHRHMYLPREFSWSVEEQGTIIFELKGQSRGDFKFGLGAGFVSSFSYYARYKNQIFEGQGAYCEYIDIRPLIWQEKNQKQTMFNQILQSQLCTLKKQTK